jgi:hypothetical protein
MKEFKPKFQPIMPCKNTNQHNISHWIRSIAENANITEKIKYFKDENEFCGFRFTRKVLGINDSRILLSGIPTIQLTPSLSADDEERQLNCRTKLQNFNDSLNNCLSENEAKQLKNQLYVFDKESKNIRFTKHYEGEEQVFVIPQPIEQQTRMQNIINARRNHQPHHDIFEGTLQEYFEIREDDNLIRPAQNEEILDRQNHPIINNSENSEDEESEHNDDEEQQHHEIDHNVLINLTDVIYYLSNDDLYRIADKINYRGAIIVGTAHVPKYLDNDTHFVQFDNIIEGEVTISPNTYNHNTTRYMIEDCAMVMKMKGNHYPYCHPLRYMKYLHANMKSDIILPLNTNPDFILKMVPVEKFDCGATYYIRFEIQKFPNPVPADYLTGDILSSEAHAYMREVNKYIQDNPDARPNTIARYARSILEINVSEQYTRECREPNNDQYVNDVLYKIHYRANPLASFNVDNTKGKLQLNQTVITVPENYVIKKDGTYFFTKTVNNENKTTVYRMDAPDIKYLVAYDTAIPTELVNKIQSKFLLAETIDKSFIKEMIAFAQQQCPKLSITDKLIPMIAKIMQDILEEEKAISVLYKSNLTNLINSMKLDEFEIEQNTDVKYGIFRRISNWFYRTFLGYEINNVNLSSNIQVQASTTTQMIADKHYGLKTSNKGSNNNKSQQNFH